MGVHGSDLTALKKVKQVSPQTARAVEANFRLFNQGYILEIQGHTDPAVNGVWYLQSKECIDYPGSFLYFSHANVYTFARPCRELHQDSPESVSLKVIKHKDAKQYRLNLS